MLAHRESLRGTELAFTDRLDGTSAPPYDGLNLALHTGDEPDRVLANRRLLGDALALPATALVFGEQVHGTGVQVVAAASAEAAGPGLPATDGLVTTERGLGLVMMGADCLPVLLAADGVVGAAHVGRAGLAAGVLPEVVRRMRAEGAREISARIGSGICGRCYEVPADVADGVEQRAPGSRSATRIGTASVDLAAGAERQLRERGIDDVVWIGGCTLEQPERFFSYRRDGVTGRHAGVIWLP